MFKYPSGINSCILDLDFLAGCFVDELLEEAETLAACWFSKIVCTSRDSGGSVALSLTCFLRPRLIVASGNKQSGTHAH